MTKLSRWRRAAVLIATIVPSATIPAASASTVDVALRVKPGGSPPDLALTGYPMFLLLALLAVLVAAGLLLLSAGRERAESQTGKGS